MFSFVTVDKNGHATRLIQNPSDALNDGMLVVYYVNCQGYVEFDGSAHNVSAFWLVDCVGRWTRDGSVIQGW